MIQVKFEESFLQELERLDGEAIIKGVRLQDPDSTLSDLFSCGGVWRKDSNRLEIYLELPDTKVADSQKSESGIDPKSEIKKILFYTPSDTLAFSIYESSGSSLVFAQKRNLLSVIFPARTVVNVKVLGVSDDIKFLEGPGTTIGTNIFRHDSEDDELVSKSSYYRYVQTKSTDDTGGPRKNVIGEGIAEDYTYREYSDFTISCPSEVMEAGIPSVFSLSKDGGVLPIHGTAKYKEYRVVSGRDIELVGSGEIGIDSIPDVIIESKPVDSESELNLKIDNYTKSITYSGTGEAFIWLHHSGSGKESGKLLISTYTQNEDWRIESPGTKYSENSCPLYLFAANSSTLGQKKTLTIYTRFTDITTHDVDITYSDDEIKDLVKITKTIASSGSGKELRFDITTKEDNQDPNSWYPYDLPTIKISYNDFSQIIYVAEAAAINSKMELVATWGGVMSEMSSIFFETDREHYENLAFLVKEDSQ